MHSDKSLISVVIPVYNAAHFLPEAVASVVAQNHIPTEIILVDDGSSDNTPEVSNELIANAPKGISIQYFRQDNQGPSATRNTGIAKATGEFVAFLDADDLFMPDKFNIQLRTFAEDPSLEIVAGRIQYVSLEGAEEREVKYDPEDQAVVHVHLGSMLVRRSVFDKIGVFDAGLRFSEDVEWWLRIREVPLAFVILHDIVLQYRLHSQNMTRGLSGVNRPFLEALKKSLSRRRETGHLHLKQMSDSIKPPEE